VMTEYMHDEKSGELYSEKRFGKKIPLKKVNDFFCLNKRGECEYHHIGVDIGVTDIEREDNNPDVLMQYLKEILNWSRLPWYAQESLLELKYTKSVK